MKLFSFFEGNLESKVHPKAGGGGRGGGVTLHINVLWKQKGSSENTHTYRSISLRSIIVKVVMNILLTKLTFLGKSTSKTQFGYGTYVIKKRQEIVFISNREFYTCYVALTTA